MLLITFIHRTDFRSIVFGDDEILSDHTSHQGCSQSQDGSISLELILTRKYLSATVRNPVLYSGPYEGSRIGVSCFSNTKAVIFEIRKSNRQVRLFAPSFRLL